MIWILLLFPLILSCGNGLGVSGDITQVDEACIILSEDASDWIGCQPACPNPAGQLTKFTYPIPQSSFVEVKVFSKSFSGGIVGNLVQTLVLTNQAAGLHQVIWSLKDSNGRDLGNGLYRVRFFADGELFCEGDVQILR